MEPIVKEFLESRRSAERQKFEKERDEWLVSLGLVENVKEYSPDGTKTPGHVGYVKFDEEANKYYRVKKVPVAVTDEEFEEIRKVAAKPKPVAQNKSIPDGTEWGLKIVNGIFWLLAIGGFIAVISICSSVLSGEDPMLQHAENVWQESVVIQTEALIVSVSQLVAISVIAIGLCFMVKLLLKIIKNQNEIKSMMK